MQMRRTDTSCTQPIEYINRAILGNLKKWLTILQETHLWLQKIPFSWQLTLFLSHPRDFNMSLRSHYNFFKSRINSFP